jgi:hypothetical protein
LCFFVADVAVFIADEQAMICFDKELIFEIMGGEVVVAFAYPIVKYLHIWSEANQEALLQCIQSIIASSLKVINKQLVSLNLHEQEVEQVCCPICWFDVLSVQLG